MQDTQIVQTCCKLYSNTAAFKWPIYTKYCWTIVSTTICIQSVCFQLRKIFSTKSWQEVICFIWKYWVGCQDNSDHHQRRWRVETPIQTKVWTQGSTSERNKTTILHWFLLARKRFFLSQSICRQVLVLWYLAVCRLKGSVMRSVVFCSIYTYVSFNTSTIFSHVQRFWRVGLLWVEYQAPLPLLIHITLMRCVAGTPSHHDVCLCRTPSGVDRSNCCCGTACLTSLTSLSSSCFSWRWQVVVIVYSLRRSKRFLSLYGQQVGIVSRATVKTALWLLNLSSL